MVRVGDLWVEAGKGVTTGPIHILHLTPQKFDPIRIPFENMVLINQTN